MSDSDAPYLVILLYHTLSVLVICQSNSKNSRRALFICKYPQLCSPKVKINFRFRFPCLIILSTSFCHFLTKKMEFIIKVSVDSFAKRKLLSYDCIIISQFRDGSGPTLKKIRNRDWESLLTSSIFKV